MKTGGKISGVILAGVAFAAPAIARADGPQAIATAAQHAGLAASQGAIGGVQTHLQHALNCLVGPDAEGFDEAAANPCAAAGGAIPQTGDAEMKAKLEELAADVSEALAGTDLAALKEFAANVQKTLTE
jgi:hypothetical protein